MNNNQPNQLKPKTSLAENVRVTLRAIGKPMSIREITVAINGDFKHRNVSNISATVANLISQGQVRPIKSIGPGRSTYELT